MASGLPDYFRLVRPRYGAATLGEGSEIVTASDITLILTITGKGVIYGGVLSVEGARSQDLDVPLMIVDEFLITNTNFFSLNKYGLNTDKIMPFYITKFDDVTFDYSVGISSGYTFEKSIQIGYTENETGTPTVVAKVIYALL